MNTEFKVICTNSNWESVNRLERFFENIFGRNKSDPIENGIYTVVDIDDYVYYVLKEFPNMSYRKEYFLPLDEVKMCDYKKEEIEFLN